MCDFLDGAEKGRRTRNGTLYYNEFQTHFWERVDDEFDRIHSRNISNQTSPNNRNRRTSTDNRSRSRRTSTDIRSRRRRRSASPPQRNTSNTNAPDLQPPSYADATNAQQVNENNPDNEINATGNSDSMSVAD